MNREHKDSLSFSRMGIGDTIDILSGGDETERKGMEYRINSHKIKIGVTEIVNWCQNRIDNIGCCKDSPSVKQEGEHLLHFIKTLLSKHLDHDSEEQKTTLFELDYLLTKVTDRLDAGEISTERNPDYYSNHTTYFVEDNLLDDEEQEWRRAKSEEGRKFLQEERKKEQQAEKEREEERRNNLTDEERELEEQERQARTRATRRRSRKEEN